MTSSQLNVRVALTNIIIIFNESHKGHCYRLGMSVSVSMFKMKFLVYEDLEW